MEQKMRFGLVLGQSALLKKTLWADYEQLLRAGFSCFRGQKNIYKKNLKNLAYENMKKPALKSCS